MYFGHGFTRFGHCASLTGKYLQFHGQICTDFAIHVLVLWRWLLRKINQLHWLLCDIFVIAFSFLENLDCFVVFFLSFLDIFEKKMFWKLWIFLKMLDYLDKCFFYWSFFNFYIFGHFGCFCFKFSVKGKITQNVESHDIIYIHF